MSPKPFQAIIVAIPILLFGWLSWQFLVPTGTFILAHSVTDRSAFIDPIRPDSRVQTVGSDVRLVGDPTYTFIHPHRQFASVEVKIRFRNEGVPIVEAGGLLRAENGNEVYDLQPLENTLIDQSTWKRLDENGLALLQRVPTYASVAAFLAHPPTGSRIATYRFDGVLPSGTKRLLPSLDLSAVDFIIGRYTTPQKDHGWSVATIHLDPSILLMQKGAWKIAFSTPGAAPGGPDVILHSLFVKMTRPTTTP